MNPPENQLQRSHGAQPRPSVTATSRNTTQDAAANIIREQINSIYGGNSGEPTPHTTPVSQPVQVQQSVQTQQRSAVETQSSGHGLRTAPPESPKSEIPIALQNQSTDHRPRATPEQWQQYHTAWQKYYQLYYERYYTNHIQSQAAQLQAQKPNPKPKKSTEDTVPDFEEETPEKAAMRQLREQIRNKVRDGAKTVKKSRHFIPIMAGVAVFLVFMFLQYNRALFGMVAAYTTPGNIDPQNIIVDPTTEISVGPEPRLIIPKINVDAPVVYGAAPDVKSQNQAMERGVAHFAIAGANAVPGQIGNTVLAAHSSNDAFAAGDYKFVFAQNEKLQKGDMIYVNYESKRYTYSITSTEVVMPHEVGKVQLQTDKPMLTLISCVPIGTAEKRLLIFAEQISPDPKQAEIAKETTHQSQDTNIPGKPSPTLIERLFGAN